MKIVATKLIPLLNLLGSWEASYPAEADLLAKQLIWQVKFGILSGRPRASVHVVEGKG